MERARVVVIGGGVVGCAILWELARRGLPGLLLEAGADVGEGTSKANSGIVHTGFDAHPGTVEAAMLTAARDLWPDVIERLGVPFLPLGALMLARTDEEAVRLRNDVATNAAAMGVEVELLDRAALRTVAPYVAMDAVAALSIPGEAVIDPFWLTRAFAEGAIAAGAEVRRRKRVVGLDVRPDAITLRLADGHEIEAEQVIDAAGLHADDVAGMAGDRSFTIHPRKGQFLVSEETFRVDRIVLPIPGPRGKGVLVTPIVFGGLLLGPTAVDGTDKDDTGIDAMTREHILAGCETLVPAIAAAVPVRQFAGLRHVSSSGDFILRPSERSDRLYLAAGIRSTGVSTSPAIARAVAIDVAARRGWSLDEHPRRAVPPPTELPDEPGEIVCLCRSISRGEIESAARRPTMPDTLDAIKRRGGAMFGDCQGNLCALDVACILASERGVDPIDMEQHRPGSWLWVRQLGGSGADKQTRPHDQDPSGPWDVVVIGGGAAGRAAADAIGRGPRTLVIERSVEIEPRPGSLRGTTVVGISPRADGWLVLGQGHGGPVEVAARSVILATGAFVVPAEYRAIGGTRPAGLMTADRARLVLAAGFLPGSRIALVGHGGHADLLAHTLVEAGAAVTRIDQVPSEVRGRARVEAIRVGADWIDADTLILADTSMAQTFLLRGLGLVDGVPGRPAPVGTDGHLPIDGLWAAGCCVRPDLDHSACATDGAAVGRRVVASLAIADRVPTSSRLP